MSGLEEVFSAKKPFWEVLKMKIADEDFFMKNSELSMKLSRYVLEHPI